MKTKSDFLQQWFVRLNSENICYAVLRNYQWLPYSCDGSDVDIWVKKEDYKKFVRITDGCAKENEGALVSYTPDSTCPRIIYQALGWGVQLDVHIDVAIHRGVPYMTDTLIESHIVKYNGVKILSKEIDSLICFLKEVLNNKKCKEEYCIQVSELFSHISDSEVDECLSNFSEKVRRQLREVIRNRYFSKEALCELGILCSHDLQSFSSRIKYSLNQSFKLGRLFKQPGYTIAFLGTDGAGKSTVINAITPILNDAFHHGVRYEHMRPNHFPSLAVFMGKNKADGPSTVCSNPHASKPSGWVGSLFRVSYYMLDYTWGYFRKVFLDKAFKTHVWLFDRYFYDYLIDPRRAKVSLPQWILQLYSFFVPVPDIILCLGGDPQKIFVRKSETSLEEVIRQTDALRDFCNHNSKAVWVDTTIAPQESIDCAMEAIKTMMARRFSNIKL